MNTTEIKNFINALSPDNYNPALKLGRGLIVDFTNQQYEQYDQGTKVHQLLTNRSDFTDQLLTQLWQYCLSDKAQQQLSLFAVGGYGRKELQPYSDIDILIFGEGYEPFAEEIANFIRLLWDIGYEVGHAVRNSQQTIDAAKDDVATATNLVESRFITGAEKNKKLLDNVWDEKQLWPSATFFQAKLEEQIKRHERYQDTTYQLEPNVKESPGGLRDIHNIFWIAKRHYGANSIQELVEHNFINQQEFEEIVDAYNYLNEVRFTLHRYKKRSEDRLLLEYQQILAEQKGLKFEYITEAVEAYMKPYYQKVQTVAKLNEILIQYFNEQIFTSEQDIITDINPRFHLVNNYLDCKKDKLFEKNPTALLEIFLILSSQIDTIKGIRSRTIRLIRNNLHLINQQFRADAINKALFIEIFRQPKGVNASLKRMHSYGILGAYLPVFEKISGLMQFNIFHAYTVDEHTLLVIRNLRRFFIDEFAFESPTAHQIASTLPKPEILLLAGLFHDIAKGRDGAHEKLGAIDAQQFGTQHNLSKNDTELLSWLVLAHLDFSYYAQKKDLSDPKVITEFAKKMASQERLDYLYLLTVADVISTSPDTWNEWINHLFLQLYNLTSQALDVSIDLPKSRTKQALKNKEGAMEQLNNQGIAPAEYQTLWQEFNNTDFFSQHNHHEIARITKTLLQDSEHKIITSIAKKPQRGATELILLMEDRDYLFAQITKQLDRLQLNVMEAKIYTGNKNKTLVIVHFLDQNNQAVTEQDTIKEIKTTLQHQLSLSDEITNYKQKEPRILRAFDTQTEIKFTEINQQRTELTINTKDIPGLLAKIGEALKESEIRLHDAKINTVGEKVEDVFIISTVNNKALTNKQAQKEFTINLLNSIEK